MDEYTDSLVRLDRQPSRAILRSFGIALAVMCCARGLLLWRQNYTVGQPAWILGAAIFVAIAGLRPQLLRGLYVVIGVLSYPVRWLAAFSILSLLYFAVITPIAWLFRLTRRSKTDHTGQSAWRNCKPRGDKSDYFRQF